MPKYKIIFAGAMAFWTLFSMAGCSQPTTPAPSLSSLACAPAAEFAYVALAPKIDKSLSFRELKNLDSPLPKALDSNQEQLGHYESALDTAVSYETTSTPPDEAGASSACLSRLNLSPTLKPVIYLAREMPEGGCLYTATETHEKRHHEIQSRMQQEAMIIFSKTKTRPLPKVSGSPAEIKSQIDAFIRQQADELNLFLQSYPLAEQQAFDSPEEYARISQLCSGEVRALFLRNR